MDPCPDHRPRRTLAPLELVAHVLLTLLTCGAWGAVLFVLVVVRLIRPRPCTTCGRT